MKAVGKRDEIGWRVIVVAVLLLARRVGGWGESSSLAVVEAESATVCGIQSASPHRFIACYSSSHAFTLAPNISFSSVAGGGSLLCGLLHNSYTLICWDTVTNSSSFKRLYNNATSPLVSLSVGNQQLCAIVKATNRLKCWRNRVALPTSQFIVVSSGPRFSCGVLLSNNSLQCWGPGATGIQSDFAGIRLTTISCGGGHACGFDTNRTLVCKGDNTSGQLNIPNQFSFSEVSLGFAHTCGITLNRSVTCWGDRFAKVYDNITSSVSFSVVSSGQNFSCGVISQNLSVVCWGPAWPYQLIPFPRPVLPGACFPDDSACNSCGVLPNSEILCGGSAVICQPCAFNASSPTLVYVRRSNKKMLILGIVGSAGALMGICAIMYVAYKCGRKEKVHNSVQPTIARGGSGNTASRSSNSGNIFSRSSTLRRQVSRALRRPSIKHRERACEFSLKELAEATDGFSIEHRVGAGSFGVVYRGGLGDGREVAIKRGQKTANGDREAAFQSELTFLSRLHHKHLVRLVGFCEDGDERLLVYDFMKNGALYDHLHNRIPNQSPVEGSWKMRIKLALDAARGIEYLHAYAVPPIIHRDIKSSNILIDADWNARVSDFGLSMMRSDQWRVQKAVGTVGYVDPEYFGLNVLSEKTDVYCFGVVLLEIITGKTAVFKEEEEGDAVNLVDYAVARMGGEEIGEILDSRVEIRGMFEADAVELVGNTALHCLKTEGKDRPTMTDIVANLERALAIIDEPRRDSASSGIVSLVSN